jgi:glycosyltransferase involved in cell wall biosynthesis
MPSGKCIIYVANTSWYLYNFRLTLMKQMVEGGWRVVAVAPPDKYSESLKASGIEYHPMRLSRNGLNPFSETYLILRLLRLYREIGPALIHHFTIKPVIYGSLAARLARVPSVVNAVTGLGYVYSAAGPKGKLLKAGADRAYHFALNRKNTYVIFQNPDDRDAFVSNGLLNPWQAVLIRGSGVNMDRFSPAPEPEGEAVILLSARMLWNKGIGTLVQAARLLKKWRMPGRIVLAGDVDPGNPESISERQLQEWNEEGIVTWLGHRSDMPDVLKDSHIAVLPTTYGEGVPRSLIEAAACGRPIVATDVPGCREIVRHGENGLLVPASDPRALAEALRTLAEDPSLRKDMGAKGREIALAEFAEERVNDSTVKLYNELLGGRYGFEA